MISACNFESDGESDNEFDYESNDIQLQLSGDIQVY